MSESELTEDMRQQLSELASTVAVNSGRIDDLESGRDRSGTQTDETSARADQAHVKAALDRRAVAELSAEGAVSRQHTDQLEEALKSSRTIGMALGMIMQAMDVDSDTAFAILSRISQSTNRKIRDLADELVQSRDVHTVLRRR